jgi:hypothetical protein
MPIFGSFKRARATEDAKEVTDMADLKSWVSAALFPKAVPLAFLLTFTCAACVCVRCVICS